VVPHTERLWDVGETCAFLGYSRNQLYIACREGQVPHFRVLGSIRFDPDQLRAWLEANRRGPVAASAR
jgi:predicted DNA-binding transcriptional regulator AlpA